jgi:hypothetical protein
MTFGVDAGARPNRQLLRSRCKGDVMRLFVASLIVVAVLYLWDKEYNNGRLLDALDSMRRSISHHMFP